MKEEGRSDGRRPFFDVMKGELERRYLQFAVRILHYW